MIASNIVKKDYSKQGNSFLVSRWNVPMAHFEMEYQALRFIETMVEAYNAPVDYSEWDIKTVFVPGIWDRG
jgi:hypothetical protein